MKNLTSSDGFMMRYSSISMWNHSQHRGLSLFRVDPIPYDTPKPAGHTRFVCVSDTHSRTDGIQMPYGDVLLHMGDFTELGLPSEVKKFNDWLGTELFLRRTFIQMHAPVSHTQSSNALIS